MSSGLDNTYILISFSISEDVSESIVPWWAHTYSAERVPMETIVAIEDAIPARYYLDFCLIVLHCPKTISLLSRHSSSSSSTKNQVGGAFIVVGRYQTKLGQGFQQSQPDKARCHHQTRDHCPLSSSTCLNLAKYIGMVI